MAEPTKTSEEWLQLLKQSRGVPLGEDYGLHLQAWLETQDSEITGCRLMDNPMIAFWSSNDPV